MGPVVRLRRLEEREEFDLVESSCRIEVTWIAVTPLGGDVISPLDERSDDLVLEGPLRRQPGHVAALHRDCADLGLKVAADQVKQSRFLDIFHR